jgi:hypothetical protein
MTGSLTDAILAPHTTTLQGAAADCQEEPFALPDALAVGTGARTPRLLADRRG